MRTCLRSGCFIDSDRQAVSEFAEPSCSASRKPISQAMAFLASAMAACVLSTQSIINIARTLFSPCARIGRVHASQEWVKRAVAILCFRPHL